ncbi:zinc finger protein 2 isoform X3 [Drosophila albomicans]|nr:zinc finger protein 2 isoform X3 [Drosophila albomicans]
MSSSDVKTFNGKIVYNLDGSAFIIDAGNANVPSCTSLTSTTPTSSLSSTFDAHLVGPTSTYSTKTETRTGGGKRAQGTSLALANKVRLLQDQIVEENGVVKDYHQLSPKIHSFRVVSAQDVNAHCEDGANVFQTHSHKPILMCFICKLSFGNVNSFSLHAKAEHALNLVELEQQLLKREYSSAIIQRNMDEKPQISFLQPLDPVNADVGDSGNGCNLVETSAVIAPKRCPPDSDGNDDHRNDDDDNISDDGENDIEKDDEKKENADKTIAISKVAVNSTVKLSSSNPATIKTNNTPSKSTSYNTNTIRTTTTTSTLTSTTAPSSQSSSSSTNLMCVSSASISAPALASASLLIDMEVLQQKSDDSPLATRTDNLSSDKLIPIEPTSFMSSISPTSRPHPADAAHSNHSTAEAADASEAIGAGAASTAADILHQHLISLQGQQQSVHSTGGIFPPIEAPAHTHLSSFHASLAALAANEQNARSVKLLSDFLQQQLQNQQQQQLLMLPSKCPEHTDFKGVDCKTCELIDIQTRTKSPGTLQSSTQCQPQRSPNTSSSGGLTTPMPMPISPSASSAVNMGSTTTASSFTIGACSDHINGRPQGVDCARCEMLLNSARLNSGVQMSTRNSCKTLKCPQCNWHYKYQETLEIHMREKHPDGESACGYCLAGQQHPRLARGESYSCGYKPYRCEICNYSTTTKGNLSIHMQSDKHLNNMQELNSSQNMVAKLLLPSSSSSQSQGVGLSATSQQQQASLGSGAGAGSGSSSSGSISNNATNSNVNNTSGSPALPSSSSAGVSAKPKPSFRCDICSYETSVARNLRIHMTSEKHTHNMAVLQNNIKHIQAFNLLQQQQLGPVAGAVAGGSANSFLPVSEVALADLAYNQALMIQLIQQNAAVQQQQQQQQQQNATNCTKISPTSPSTVSSTPDQFTYSPKALRMGLSMGMGMGIATHSSESSSGDTDTTQSALSSSSLPDLWPTAMYSCQVCECFSTNNMDELNQHLLLDRSRQSSNNSPEIMVIHNNNYICRLCNYKTNLKANFQLHSKTDKHLQKLSFINHIREGGARNEYKLQQYHQPQLATNVVQLKCNCCDFHTNSIQKLSLHSQQMRHDTLRMIFQHLLYLIQQSQMRKLVQDVPMDQHEDHHPQKLLSCQLCNFRAKNLYDMIVHVKGLRHMQVEQFICLQRRSENLEMLALNEVFKIYDESSSNNEDGNLGVGLNLSATVELVEGLEADSASVSLTLADNNIFSPASISSGSTIGCKNTNLNQNSNTNETTTVFKCNLCENFLPSKKEMILHLEAMHPTAESDDFISIPTNTTALQAFQTAVAAAALAAVQRCSITPTTAANEGEDVDISHASATAVGLDCGPGLGHFNIKREQLDSNENRADEQDNTDKNSNDLESQRGMDELRPMIAASYSEVSCPLCLEHGYSERSLLEAHLMSVHNVMRDGLDRLLQLVDHKTWQRSASSSSSKKIEDEDLSKGNADNHALQTATTSIITSSNITTTYSSSTGGDIGIVQGICCQQCDSSFKHEEQLLQHAQQTQHYPMQNNEYICLAVCHVQRPCFMRFQTLPSMLAHFKDVHMSLVFSERHVYKYRCKQCSLAFKTQEKLTTHMLYHTMRDATKCSQCQRNFRTTQALQKHMELAHGTADDVPRDLVSPVCNANNDIDKMPNDTNIFDLTTRAPSEQAVKMSEIVKNTSDRSRSPITERDSPANGSIRASTPPLPTEQQQQLAALRASLVKKQEQDVEFVDAVDAQLACQLQGKGQHIQQQLQDNLRTMNSQGLQSLQNFQQVQQQISNAAAVSGMPINPVDMLNLMQFHHLMSLNFMNLAPPLIFGANSGSTGCSTPSTVTAASTVAQNNKISNISSTGPGEISTSATVEVPSNINTILGQSTGGNNQQQLSNNQKRARTRITDDQLKILRAHFDINNSPSEESIMEMSQKANLPMKVVKHWFRNTLFKERQRNKDSPYNFNNPPSTTLNLEEYERTGNAKVTSLTDTAAITPISTTTTSSVSVGSGAEITTISANAAASETTITNASSSRSTVNVLNNLSDCFQTHQVEMGFTKSEQSDDFGNMSLPLDVQIKTEFQDDNLTTALENQHQHQHQQLQQQQHPFQFLKQQKGDTTADSLENVHDQSPSTSSQQLHQQQQQQQQVNCFETKSESGSSDVLSRPQTPNLYNSMNDLLSQQLDHIGSNMGPPKLQTAGKSFEKLTGSIAPGAATCSQLDNNSSNSSNSSSSTSGGKRANRTRFTDYQIKVLQEFFENNSYPKDSDLEYLSKLLLLSPRVIVVWFQNARQKQRKIYENQPNNSVYESEETKKQNINYACKKCNLVFQRYYELIRHQKNHCFKEENNKKSAKAQIAAAQIAQNLSSEDSNSSMDIHHNPVPVGVGAVGLSQNVAAAAAVAVAAAAAAAHSQFSSSPSPQHLFSKSSSLTDFSPSTTPTPPQRERSNSLDQQQPQQSQRLLKLECDKCELQFNHLDSLREHQLMHLMNPGLFNSSDQASYGPFGSILQSLQHAAQQQQLHQHQQQHLQQHEQIEQQISAPAAKKRKISDNAEDATSLSEFETSSISNFNKSYEFLFQYFMLYETNTETKQQFLNQRQQQRTGGSQDELDFLSNFYQQSELKKINSYDFLLQYYRQHNEETQQKEQQSSFSSSKKPTIEFLLQYYQLNESKKFFQLVASTNRTADGQTDDETVPSSQQPNVATDETHKYIGKREEQEKAKTEIDLIYSKAKSHTNGGASMGNHKRNCQNGFGLPSTETNNDSIEPLNNNNHINVNLGAALGMHFDLTRHSSITDNATENDIVKDNERPDDDGSNMGINSDTKFNHIGLLRSSEKVRHSSDVEKSQYFQNLEEFLDATMIENNSQMLTFNDDDTNPTKIENINTSASVIINGNTNTSANDSLPSDSSSVQLNAPSKQNKRLRTTILPEQLNFLYECYQTESNPSRKMLEEISKKVNLKKRVVQIINFEFQVWFQNSRAKDKKSRNQRQYSHISDDNNSIDGSNSKETGNSNNNSKYKCSRELAAVQESKVITSSSAASVDGEQPQKLLQDCQLCQMPQVNMQTHAISVQHICKMKAFIEQTSELYNQSNASGSEDNDSDREKRFYSLSKAFLLQHVVNNMTSSTLTSTALNENHCETVSEMDDNLSGAMANDSSNNDKIKEKGNVQENGNGKVTAVGTAFTPIDITVNDHINNDEDEEMSEISRKKSSANRDLMQQLFNRNHITGKSCGRNFSKVQLHNIDTYIFYLLRLT